MVISALLIVTNQLFSVLGSSANLILDKAYESLSMGSMFELKVKALSVLFASNVSTLFLCIILKNQLFQEQESPFVIDLLSNLNLSKFLPNCCSTRVKIIVYVFNVKNDVLCHSVSAKYSLELMLEISLLINFISLHSLNINNMNKLGNLIDQHHWTNPSHLIR